MFGSKGKIREELDRAHALILEVIIQMAAIEQRTEDRYAKMYLEKLNAAKDHIENVRKIENKMKELIDSEL